MQRILIHDCDLAELAASAEGKPDPACARLHPIRLAGLLPQRDWFDQVFKQGTYAIRWCKNHKPLRCQCWRKVRDLLWGVRCRFAEKSAESWTALRTWETFEELESASRPERLPGIIDD